MGVGLSIVETKFTILMRQPGVDLGFCIRSDQYGRYPVAIMQHVAEYLKVGK